MDSWKRVIVVSGINGCGKTSFIEKIKEIIPKFGATVEVFKAPYYDSPSGQDIKRYLAGEHFDDVEDLFARNRSEVYQKIAMSNADVILVDRLDLDADVFATLRETKAKYYGKRQRVTMQILLDVDESVALERLQQRQDWQRYYSMDVLKDARRLFLDKMKTGGWAERQHLVLDSAEQFTDRKLWTISRLIVSRA